MLTSIYIRMALTNLRTAKWRSFLTMLGIIIGVMSVIIMVGISEGVKQQILHQAVHTNAEAITLRPGHVVHRDAAGHITDVNFLSAFGATTFTQADLDTVSKTPHVASVTPFSVVSGLPQADTRTFDNGFIIATSDQAGKVLGLKLAYGTFFSDQDSVKDGAVIGQNVADQLFNEGIPIGRAFTIRDQTFRVRGVLEKKAASPIVPYSDYNDAIIIPSAAGKQLNGGADTIFQMIVEPDTHQQSQAVHDITARLQQAHAGQVDFTVLKGNEAFAPAGSLLQLMTSFVTGVAAIAVLVGGIGIMNIMLVSVTERTREIGIRKAVGATNKQILMQFLIEALVLSTCGGLVGIGLSFVANYFLRIFTSLQPAISWQIIGLASIVAILVGVFFGVTPAIKAARKDPIDALRSV